jgi:polyisoprenoid-binding protein YceI
MNKNLLTLLTTTLLSAAALGAPQEFDFKDPKGVNNATFNLDALLEAITGSANGVSGKVSFDPAHPGATTGAIVIDANSLTVPNSMMKDHMLGEQWLNTATHKEIRFETKSLKNIKTNGDTTTADAVGTFTLKGITKEITAPIKLTYLKDKLGARTNGRMNGDLLVIRSTLTIKRTDFDVNPGAPEDKVANEIEVSLSIAGSCPQ